MLLSKTRLKYISFPIIMLGYMYFVLHRSLSFSPDIRISHGSGPENTVKNYTVKGCNAKSDEGNFFYRSHSTLCDIPYLTPVKYSPRRNFVQNCSYEKKIAHIMNYTTLVLEGSQVGPKCCFQEILRFKNTDRRFSITKCQPFTKARDVQKKEVISVHCDNSINVLANIPIKPRVREKLDYWKLRSRPPSVLIVGIDSVSTIHVHEHLPKTLSLLKAENFKEFSGYHSVAPSTLTNFMAFLLGMTRGKVRSSCCQTWATPFDHCPFIWKDFDEHNYITGYVEDGSMTFHWGGQGGFNIQPTDYYLHRLFLALRKFRLDQKRFLNARGRQELDCTSSQTVPQFILNYTLSFVDRFERVPFFLISWITNPFHEYREALASYDSEFHSVFQHLTSKKIVANTTLIIFMSDHGNRMSYRQHDPVKSFFERALPVLLVRMPEQITQDYPSFNDAFIENTGKFTTPFDLHHTLLHLIHLHEDLENKTMFLPQHSDRSSWFVPFRPTRTCLNTNIPATHCLCNTNYVPIRQQNIKLSNEFIVKLYNFSLQKLNEKIGRSSYARMCAPWKTNKRPKIRFARHIIRTTEYNEFVIAFEVSPLASSFEARIRLGNLSGSSSVLENNFNTSLWNLVGIWRSNRYGEQSSCVNYTTDVEKELKELCMCKSYLYNLNKKENTPPERMNTVVEIEFLNF